MPINLLVEWANLSCPAGQPHSNCCVPKQKASSPVMVTARGFHTLRRYTAPTDTFKQGAVLQNFGRPGVCIVLWNQPKLYYCGKKYHIIYVATVYKAGSNWPIARPVPSIVADVESCAGKIATACRDRVIPQSVRLIDIGCSTSNGL
jgi:hypothetical protein